MSPDGKAFRGEKGERIKGCKLPVIKTGHTSILVFTNVGSPTGTTQVKVSSPNEPADTHP